MSTNSIGGGPANDQIEVLEAVPDPGPAMVVGRDEFHAPPAPDFQTGSWCESLGDSNQRVIVIFCCV